MAIKVPITRFVFSIDFIRMHHSLIEIEKEKKKHLIDLFHIAHVRFCFCFSFVFILDFPIHFIYSQCLLLLLLLLIIADY